MQQNKQNISPMQDQILEYRSQKLSISSALHVSSAHPLLPEWVHDVFYWYSVIILSLLLMNVVLS